MHRVLVSTLLGLLLVAGPALGQDGIQRGKIKKVDAATNTITITVDGKDQDVVLTESTRVRDAEDKEIDRPLESKALRPGAAVVFRAESKDGKTVLVGLRLGGAVGARPGPGQGILRGKIKKLDLDRMTLTVTADGKDHDLLLTDETRVLDGRGKDLKERLEGYKEGVEIFFKPETRDGKEVAAGLKRVDSDNPPTQRPTLVKVDTSKLKSLTELGTDEYQGFKGGLYPEGKNERPAAHEAAGVRLAKQVQPLDAEGKPSADGKIVLMSVGMSNTSQASQAFQRQVAADPDRNPHLVFLNGAQGGMTAAAIQDPDDGGRGTQYWMEVDNRLKQAGLTRAQVQAIWIKQADAGPTQGFPKYAQKLQEELERIVQMLPKRFPNIKLVYLSGRTYGGYAKTALNPEPYAYESGFSVKWLIEKQIAGDAGLNYDAGKGAVKAPWLSWGPYLWANGSTKRADGFSYDESDFSPQDGTHESPSGQQKVGRLLLDFFKSDTTTKPWFVKR
jgi:hypothetical protein